MIPPVTPKERGFTVHQKIFESIDSLYETYLDV